MDDDLNHRHEEHSTGRMCGVNEQRNLGEPSKEHRHSRHLQRES